MDPIIGFKISLLFHYFGRACTPVLASVNFGNHMILIHPLLFKKVDHKSVTIWRGLQERALSHLIRPFSRSVTHHFHLTIKLVISNFSS